MGQGRHINVSLPFIHKLDSIGKKLQIFSAAIRLNIIKIGKHLTT